MKEYNHNKIENKIQKEWEKKKIYQAKNVDGNPTSSRLRGVEKFFSLIEFPYPSGAGMHVGHIRSNTAMDIISRKRRMEGYNVLYPIGWDAFGLPTENYAIKTGKKPALVTKLNTDTFRKQLKSLGFSFDWSREINTTDPKYYKWTQWIFLQFFKKGLAYKAKSYINWCLSCKIGLANEEVVDGKCERCGGPTEKREKEQWMLAITKYADRLYKDLDLVDYPDRVKTQQRNWIGKSEGSEIEFKIHLFQPSPYQGEGKGEILKVFTTRIDTIFGATYLVLAPEHELVKKLWDQIENKEEISAYIEITKKKNEIERVSDEKEKTGVEIKGFKAVNPANKEEIPVWISDYVLADYGTGALMAVPAHDERDFAFAKKFNLPIKNVIEPYWLDRISPPQKDKVTEKRNLVIMILRRPEDDSYLCAKWSITNWQSFPAGGIENNENTESAGRREILEETGYKNLKFIKEIKNLGFAEFYRPHKDSNAFVHFSAVIFDLENEEKVDVLNEEKDKHKFVWIPKKEVAAFLNLDSHKFIWQKCLNTETVFIGLGILSNSGKFNGLKSEGAIKEITKFVGGKIVTKFKLRDWVFSRQRYWGEPIPLIFCPACAKTSAGKENAGWIPVPDKDLPVKLPDVKSYKPTDNGESPLAHISKWVNVKCPKCKSPAKRETDTMPNWAGSSWYYLRYTDPKNNKEFASKKNLKYWLGSSRRSQDDGKQGQTSLKLRLGEGGVDWYNGGMEHTTLHLLYSRFWHKFLYDLKLVPTVEPYQKRTSHGMILGEGGVKMSKSKPETIINPDDIVKTYGADTLRIYEMFMGPFEDTVAWSMESIIGSRRFIEKVWRIGEKLASDFSWSGRASISVGKSKGEENRGPEKSLASEAQITLEKLLHKTIKKVSEDIENMRFNTAISSMMILATEMEKAETVSVDDFKKFLQILAPFAPYVSEHLWRELGDPTSLRLRGTRKGPTSSKLRGVKAKSIHLSEWPKWDENLIKDEEVKIAVQVNGKVRAEVMIQADDSEEVVKKKALENETVLKYLADAEPKKIIYIKNRIVNIVI